MPWALQVFTRIWKFTAWNKSYFSGMSITENKFTSFVYPIDLQQGHTVHALIIHVLFVQATAHFNHQMRKLRLSYGAVVSTHYLIVFFLLLAVYRRILHCIGEMRRKHGWCNQHHSNSTVNCWVYRFYLSSLLKSVLSQACEVVHISSFECVLVPFPIL